MRPPPVSLQNKSWGTSTEIPLMTCYYPDLGSASYWLCHGGNLLWPIRSAIQVWVVTHHQYGTSVRVSQTSFCWETSVDIMKCQLFFSGYFCVCMQVLNVLIHLSVLWVNLCIFVKWGQLIGFIIRWNELEKIPFHDLRIEIHKLSPTLKCVKVNDFFFLSTRRGRKSYCLNCILVWSNLC